MKKNKLIIKFLTIFFLILMLISVSESVLSSQAKIEFVKDPSYQFYKEKDNKYFYLISVTLQNTGDVSSCPVDIKIREEGFDSVCPDDCQKVIFEPGEQRTFSIEWGTAAKSDEIEVVYTASSSANVSIYNTGKKTLEIDYNQVDPNRGTPGFNILILIFALLSLIVYKKKYYKI